jgi:hypothetical protein
MPQSGQTGLLENLGMVPWLEKECDFLKFFKYTPYLLYAECSFVLKLIFSTKSYGTKSNSY